MIELVEVTRDGHVESRHVGRLVLLDGTGTRTAGGPDEPVLPRSALKPLQAAALLGCRFPRPGGALALAAASHDGEDVHLAAARATLRAAGLDEDALQCPPDLPGGRDALLSWAAAGGRAARVCHNCSGKHAAMLATCVAAGWPMADYLEPGRTRCSGPPATASRRSARRRSPPPRWTAAARRPSRSR